MIFIKKTETFEYSFPLFWEEDEVGLICKELIKEDRFALKDEVTLGVLGFNSCEPHLRSVSFDCTRYKQVFRAEFLLYKFKPREILPAKVKEVQTKQMVVDFGFITGTLRKDQISNQKVFFNSQEQNVSIDGTVTYSVGDPLLCMVNSIRKVEKNEKVLICTIKRVPGR